MKVCWVDIETTGLDPKVNGIWQAAFIIEIDGVVEAKETFYLNPEKEIEDKALSVSGVTVEEIEGYQNFREAKKVIRKLITQYINPYNRNDKFTLAGYNVDKFDACFLEQLWIDSGDKYFWSLFTHFPLDVIRIVTFAAWLGVIDQPGSMKLSSVAKKLGLEWNVGEQAHDAGADISMTRDIAYRLRRLMIGRKRRVLKE